MIPPAHAPSISHAKFLVGVVHQEPTNISAEGSGAKHVQRTTALMDLTNSRACMHCQAVVRSGNIIVNIIA